MGLQEQPFAAATVGLSASSALTGPIVSRSLRQFAQWNVIVTAALIALSLGLPGAAWVKTISVIALVGFVTLCVWLLREEKQRFIVSTAVFGAAFVVTSCIIEYRFGLLSAAPFLIALGSALLARALRGPLVHLLPLATAVSWAVLSGLVAGHLLPDSGAVAFHDHGRPLQATLAAAIGAVFLLAFLVARTDRRAQAESVRRFGTAFSSLSQFNELVLNSAGDGIYVVDLSGHISFANPSTTSLTGYFSNDLIGSRAHDLLHAGHLTPRLQACDACVAHDLAPRSVDELFWRKDGTTFPVECVISPIRADDHVLGHVVAFKDLSERRALFRILHETAKAQNLDELYRRVHSVAADLLPAKNFYIALYDEREDLLSFPYFVDEHDLQPAPRQLGRGLTAYVVRNGRPLLVDPGTFDELVHGGEVDSMGAPSVVWLGVPLISGGTTFGVVAVQSYDDKVRYGEREQELLSVVSQPIADAIVRKRSEQETRSAVSVLQATLEATADGLLVVDANGRIVSSNSAFAAMWRIPAELLAVGDDQALIAHVLDQVREPDAFLERIHQLYDHPDEESVDVLEFHDGRVFERQSRPQRLDGAAIGRVWSFRDITEKRQATARVEHQAFHDSLTSLPNRLLFRDRLERALLHAQRKGEGLALFFLDVDRFKAVNDSLGHTGGDKLLQVFADRLRTGLREQDTVARLGGDEFAILMLGVSSSPIALRMAEKLQNQLAVPITIEDTELDVSASIGVALYPHDGADGDTLLRSADLAMYRAKERGGNSFQLCTAAMNTRAVERTRLEAMLHHAVERGEFTLHYQPLVNVATGLIVGCEALLRWHHPEEGLILPGQFIPLAEETGLIVPMGEWVLKTACQQLHAWHEAGHKELRMTMNLSGRHVQEAKVLKSIKEAIKSVPLPKGSLELEITESVAMHNVDWTRIVFAGLHRIGIPISIDDFGTGQSSLSYLRLFPLSTLKIDKSFVRELDTQAESQAIVRAIVALAKALNLKTVAEGVETEEQMRFIRQIGCDEFQGFLFSKGLPAAEFEILMRSHTPAA